MPKTREKKAQKKAATKIPSVGTVPSADTTGVFRIVIDVNVNTGTVRQIMPGIQFKEAGDKPPNFTWSLTLDKVVVSSLSIGQKTVSHPDPTGSIYVEVLDPDNEIIITVIGTEFAPGGSGSLSMTYGGKLMVFKPAADLVVKNGNATFNQNVSLP